MTARPKPKASKRKANPANPVAPYAEAYASGVAFAMKCDGTKLNIRDIVMAYESGYEFAIQEQRRGKK